VRLALVACVTLTLSAASLAATGPRPTLAGPTVQGGSASLAQFRGRPVIVNVWSSW
jgi:hypothetical protein